MSKYSVGLRNVGSYMVSGQPYITGSAVNTGTEVKIEFPFVTKSITIRIPPVQNNAFDTVGVGSRFETGDVYDLGGSGKDCTISIWMKNTVACPPGTWGFSKRPWATTDGSSVNNSVRTAKHGPSGSFQVTNFHPNGVFTQPNGNDEWFFFLITQNSGSTFFYAGGPTGTQNVSGRMPYTGSFEMATFAKLVFPTNGQEWYMGLDHLTVWSDGFDAGDVAEIYNSGEWFDPNAHSKASVLESWHTMGDAAGDDPGPRSGGSGGKVIDISGTPENFNMFANGAAASVIEGPFTSQTTGKLRVHMASKADADVYNKFHYDELQGYGTTITLPMKTKELYLSAVDAQVSFEIIAELTNIPTGSMYALAGSGIDE